MPKKDRIRSDVWDKATEHIGDLPDIFVDQQQAESLAGVSALVSALPQQKVLERIGMPAAIYEISGELIVGSAKFPPQVTVSPKGSTWTAVHSGSELFIFHVVELDGKKQILCIGLNETRLHQLIPSSTRLTQAEFGVLAGVMNGQTVRNIADADGVSYNTRRRQIEAALEKLNMHSQSAVVRLIYVTLIDRLLAAISSGESDGPGINALARCYDNKIRFHWIHLSGNPPFRVAEYGDPQGRPVLLFHSMLYPCGVAPCGLDKIHEIGFRVFVPFRPGFFDAPRWRSSIEPEEVLTAWSCQCDALLSFLNVEKTDVAALAMPACWAVDFARRFPTRIRSLILLSAPQPSVRWHGQAKTASFIHSVAGIIERAPWLAEPLTRLHALRFSDGSKSLKGFRKSFRDSPADLAEIKKLAMDPNALEIVAATLRESTAGIATDLQVLLQPWETYLAGIEAPIHFVHGEADTVSPLAVIEDLIRTLPHARLHVFRNRGNLFALRSLSDALSIATAA